MPLVLAIELGFEAWRLGRDLRGRLVHLDQFGLADHLDFLVDLHAAADLATLDSEQSEFLREVAFEQPGIGPPVTARVRESLES